MHHRSWRLWGALAAALVLALPHLAFGQGATVYQNGTAIPNHIAKFVTQGRIADAGGLLGDAAGIGLSPFAVTDAKGVGLCFNDAVTSGSYHSLCFGHDSSSQPIFTIDNVVYGFAPTANGNILGPTTSTVGHIVLFNNGTGTLVKDSGYSLNLAVCLNAPGDGAIIQAAVDTGNPVHIVGPCVADTAVTLSTNGQEIYGDGPTRTILNVSTVVAGAGTFVCNTGHGNLDVGPRFHDFGITFAQVNTSNRASLTNFKPAFSCRNTPGGKIERVRVQEAMVGLDLIGQSGGWRITDLEISCLSVCIWIDGSLDSIHLTRLHIWPYGPEFTACGIGGPLASLTGLCAIYGAPNSGTPQTTIGTLGAIGLYTGRMDDIHVDGSLFLIGLGWRTFFGVGAGIGAASGATFGNVTNTDFDTYGGIAEDGAGTSLSGSSLFFSAITNDYFSVNVVAGNFRCSSCYFAAGAVGTSGTPAFQVRMVPNDVAVDTSLMLSDVYADLQGLDATFIDAESAGSLNIQGLQIKSTVASSATPVICAPCQASGTLAANISGVQPVMAQTSRVLIGNLFDGNHRFIGNGLKTGWTNSCVATQTLMRTGFNGTASNATCN